MTHKFILLIVFLIIVQSIHAQQKLPVIRANSKSVGIRDGKDYNKDAWNIVPSVRPDIYKTSIKSKHKVSFYTDIDSISFIIKPDKKYDFIILLNGTDSAYTQIKYEPTYLEILKNASQYNLNDDREITRFSYKSIVDADLVLLRKTFNLDSIAGAGNEVLQILNILHWVHNTFVHDGTKDSPEYNNIVTLMNLCINEHKTLDCGSLANVANNCFLAMGFKSRRVVCLPKDSTDMDCHSINAVYSNTLNKWLWIDPTNFAYLMNEKGELLSIAEVRERIINNKPIILNPDANWNNRYSITTDFYIDYYMTKNLYALECFVTGGGESKCNLLLPLEYKGVIPRTAIYKPKLTNNPDLFWAAPKKE